MCSITPTWRSKSRNKNRYVFWNKNPLVSLTQREDPEDSTNTELWIIWMWRAHRIICLIESAISLNKSDIDSEFESWWIHSSSAFRWLRFANCHYGPRDWPSTKMCQTLNQMMFSLLFDNCLSIHVLARTVYFDILIKQLTGQTISLLPNRTLWVVITHQGPCTNDVGTQGKGG